MPNDIFNIDFEESEYTEEEKERVEEIVNEAYAEYVAEKEENEKE